VNDSLERRIRFDGRFESVCLADVLNNGEGELAFVIFGVGLFDLVGFRLAADCSDN